MPSLVPGDRCDLRMVGPCHMSTFRFPPAPRAPAAAGAVVAAGASAVGAAAAGLAVVAAVGADRLGAADEHALISEASTPPVKPTVTPPISVPLVNPSGGGR